MRKPIIVLLTMIVFISCTKNVDITKDDIYGEWKLIEQLVDPGDGSGVFKSINSEKKLKFFDDGTLTSTNGSLCNPYSSEEITAGTFSLTENKITTNCQDPNIATIGFELKNSYLILHFISNEGFSQKYQKVK